MKSITSPTLAIITLFFLLTALPGCGVLGTVIGMKQQKEAQEQFAAQQAQRQQEAAEQEKLMEKRREILYTTLDAQTYSQSCEEIRPSVESVVTTLGHDVHYSSSPEQVITNWKYVSADYSGRNGRLEKTRDSSKSRYTADMTPSDQGGCLIKATFQKVIEQGTARNSRATDFELYLMEKLNPEGYATLNKELEAVGKEDTEAAQ